MTPSNVDIARSLHAAWERGDWSSVEWADPEIELVLADGPDPSSWGGLSAIAHAWNDFLGAWEDYRTEAQEYREIDRDRVYVLIHVSGRGKTSGLEMRKKEAANVFTFRSGKVRRLAIYWESENALADLGLAPTRAAGPGKTAVSQRKDAEL